MSRVIQPGSLAFKVMFVDDEPALLTFFRTIVEPLGCEVLTFENSGEAAQKIQKDKFDGVFLDAGMPQPDGFELARIVRASPPNCETPIVMLTGSGDVETMRKGFQAGITFFLNKPLSYNSLTTLLRTMRGAMLREKRRYARLPFRATVICMLAGRPFKSESQDISEGGMMLEKSGGATAGQEFDLEFSLPKGARPLKARARVIRRDPPDRLAIQFVSLSVTDREAIQAHVSGVVPE